VVTAPAPDVEVVDGPAGTVGEPASPRPEELAWTSFYLALVALLLLLVRGGQSGLIAALLLGLAMESAAVFFAWRGFIDAKLANKLKPQSHLARTGMLVNGILLGLLGLSVLLTLYQLVAGQQGGISGGFPGLDNLMKQMGQMNDMIKNIK
jgi:hypothetical protein